ncbi:MAG: membrane dipeptidase [Sedimentibacter sp.]
MDINKIMKEIVIIDGHTDIPKDVYQRESKGETDVFMRKHYAELKKAEVNIAFVNVFTKSSPELTLKDALLQIEKIIKVTKENDDVVLIKSKSDLDYVLKTDKLGLVLSLEGFEPLCNSLELLNIYYELGMRAGMLTWNNANSFASGADIKDGGITKFGVSAIEKMNSLGVLVDVSHINEQCFWDIIKINKQSTIASHSNAKALFNHDRNLTDEQIRAIAKNGGVIGAVSYFSKVNEDNLNVKHLDDDNTETIYDYIKHIEYLVNLVGYDYVSFGFDFNVYLGDFGVNGLESAEKIKDVIRLLLERNHKLENVKKIAGENLLRILYKII